MYHHSRNVLDGIEALVLQNLDHQAHHIRSLLKTNVSAAAASYERSRDIVISRKLVKFGFYQPIFEDAWFGSVVIGK